MLQKYSQRSPLSSLGFFLNSTLSVTEQHNKLQGSVVLKQNRAVPLGLWNNRRDPIHSALCLGLYFCIKCPDAAAFLQEK